MAKVLCRCVCGTERITYVCNLRSGKTLGCGCKHDARISKSKTRHGLSDTPEQVTWMHMRKRCSDPADKAFKNYGGRGIFVCERWANSFDAFIADMGRKPSPKHSIERINNDGPYSPENCKWATAHEQVHNRRSSVYVLYEGNRLTIPQASEATGIPAWKLYARYKKGQRLI